MLRLITARASVVNRWAARFHTRVPYVVRQLGDAAGAATCYERVLQIDPEDWRAFNNKGVSDRRTPCRRVSHLHGKVLLKEAGLLHESIAAYALAIQHFQVGLFVCQRVELDTCSDALDRAKRWPRF